MDNYDATVDPERPLGYRHLRPAETLEVDEATGEIARSFVPARVTFTENGLVRPVAPFLEVWALTDDDVLEPLTAGPAGGRPGLDRRRALAGRGRQPQGLPPHGPATRTRSTADTGDVADHDGTRWPAAAANFWPGKSIPFGSVRFIRPTDAASRDPAALHPRPGLCLRREPDAARRRAAGRPECPRHRLRREPEPGHAGWATRDSTRPGRSPCPAEIYAGRRTARTGQPRLPRRRLRRPGPRRWLTVGGRTLTAFARIGVGTTRRTRRTACRSAPSPTSWSRRCSGPTVTGRRGTLEQAEEIVRRAFETVRLMNTAAMNSRRHGRSRRGDRAAAEPIMARSLVDTVATGAPAPEPARRPAQRRRAVVRRRAARLRRDRRPDRPGPPQDAGDDARRRRPAPGADPPPGRPDPHPGPRAGLPGRRGRSTP